MSVFAKCCGTDCAVRELCTRYRAASWENQTWIAPDPKDCDYFIEWDVFDEPPETDG